MVLTRSELIDSLKNEVRILLHLCSKVDRSSLDYRPTPKQRSTLELVRYLSIMGPALFDVASTGTFDPAAWTKVEDAAAGRSFDEALATIAAQADLYERLVNAMSDADMRTEIGPFGDPSSRGAFIVNQVLAGCAAYRTQLFLYLKACGREELSTMNLWGGVDASDRD